MDGSPITPTSGPARATAPAGGPEPGLLRRIQASHVLIEEAYAAAALPRSTSGSSGRRGRHVDHRRWTPEKQSASGLPTTTRWPIRNRLAAAAGVPDRRRHACHETVDRLAPPGAALQATASCGSRVGNGFPAEPVCAPSGASSGTQRIPRPYAGAPAQIPLRSAPWSAGPRCAATAPGDALRTAGGRLSGDGGGVPTRRRPGTRTSGSPPAREAVRVQRAALSRGPAANPGWTSASTPERQAADAAGRRRGLRSRVPFSWWELEPRRGQFDGAYLSLIGPVRACSRERRRPKC